jgi:hypothetical protein
LVFSSSSCRTTPLEREIAGHFSTEERRELELNLKRDVVQPIGVGLAIFIVINIAAAALSIFGLAPTAGTATLNTTAQGIIGLVGTLWAAGKAAEITPPFVKKLLGRR